MVEGKIGPHERLDNGAGRRARIAPSDRVFPRAISQRKAPTPRRGRAAAEILKRRPKSATSQIVEVVPSVAPMIIPTACEKVTSPALTKPMTVRIAAVEDSITAVKSAPDATAPESAGNEPLERAA